MEPQPRRLARPSRPAGFLQLQAVPPLLRPLFRAYLLGYLSAVAPRLLTLVLQHLSNRRRKQPKYALPVKDEHTFAESATHILRTGLDPCRFPTFCAALVGGSTILQVSKCCRKVCHGSVGRPSKLQPDSG